MRVSRKKSDKSGLFFRIALLVFAIYTLYSMISLQSKLVSYRVVLMQKKEEKAQQCASNKKLKDLLSNGTQKELIEHAAREKLDYVYANEEVYEDISGK